MCYAVFYSCTCSNPAKSGLSYCPAATGKSKMMEDWKPCEDTGSPVDMGECHKCVRSSIEKEKSAREAEAEEWWMEAIQIIERKKAVVEAEEEDAACAI